MRERPLRSSSILPSMPLVKMPIKVLTMKMPPKVTASIIKRKGQLPESPPMVPASKVRIRLIQASWMNPGFAPSSPAGASPAICTTRAMTAIITAETKPSQAIRAAGPLDIVLSNQ
jgi:hypothetical protein